MPDTPQEEVGSALVAMIVSEAAKVYGEECASSAITFVRGMLDAKIEHEAAGTITKEAGTNLTNDLMAEHNKRLEQAFMAFTHIVLSSFKAFEATTG